MPQQTTIEWTEVTWNPVTGCTKISPGCSKCYAERFARRLQAMGQPRYKRGFAVTLQKDLLRAPLSWRTPRIVFVNSMSDLFHDAVPFEYIEAVFKTMKQASQHVFQVLTKRADRLAELAPALFWPPNVWIGVSVESEEYLSRVEALRTVEGALRFISFEPLLSAVPGLGLDGIGWVIVGGESGPGARVMQPEWVLPIRDLCVKASVPFFFKQWGGFPKKKFGRQLDGQTWDQVPSVGSK